MFLIGKRGCKYTEKFNVFIMISNINHGKKPILQQTESCQEPPITWERHAQKTCFRIGKFWRMHNHDNVKKMLIAVLNSQILNYLTSKVFCLQDN